ncbi:MAG: GAF domain-containing protein, partial [Chloroflexota bacterium]
DVVLERIGKYAKDLLRAETSAVYLYEPEKESLRAIAAFGLDAVELKDFSLKLGRGIVGNIAVNKIGEIVNNTADDPRGVIVEGTDTIADEHLMAVPVLNKGELTGLLAVWRTGANLRFMPRELEFLASLAQQAAVAIENARLFQAEQRRREEAENLRIAATAITSTLESRQVLETILVALQQVVGYDSAAIFQLEGEHVRITAAKGFPDNQSTINMLFPSNNRLLMQVKDSSQPLILRDVRESPYFEHWAGAEAIRGWMGVPLIARGEVIGFITLDSYMVGTFSEKDALLAQTFAHQAAAAIENARLFNETRQRVEELEVVGRVSVALRVAQDSQKILLVLLDEVKLCMDTDTAGIWLFDHDKAELVQKACSGGLAHLPRPNFAPGEGIVGYVFESARTHVSPEFSKDPRISLDNLTAFGKDWGGIAVAIRTTTETIGVLMVAIQNTRRIEQHHVRLLQTIAEIAGNAINRSNLYEQSEEQVRRLTTLRELDTAISSSFDLRVTLDILTEHLLSKMGVSATAILILNPDSQALTLHSAAGFRDPHLLSVNSQ